MKLLRTASIILALAGTLFAADPLDTIVGKVGEDIIMKSEVERQVQLYRLQAPGDPTPDDSLRTAALENLIEGKLMVLEAQRESVKVSEAEVEEQIGQAIENLRRNFPSEDSFKAVLRREGTTLDKLKEKYRGDTRERMTIQRLIDLKIRPRVTNPTSKEVAAFFASHKDSIPNEPEKVQLQHILIAVKPGAAAQGAAQAKMRTVLAQLRAKKRFADVAAKYSQDPQSAARGGDLGWFGRNAMVPQFEQVAFSLKPGQVSDPFLSPFGFHIIKLLERKDDQVHAAHILIRVTPGDADIAKASKTAAGLRGRIVDGKEDFGQVAKTYSDDTDSKAKGGDLGLVPVDAFPPQVKDELAVLKEGDISDVIETETGYHLIKLLKREPAREATFESVKEQLTEYLKNKKMQDEYNSWMKDLKTKHFIERSL
ncbi:MAG: peptidylprolyl isomerase [Candidatus Edwardsbacteria bacterium]|nr:peptidylprolyl isomerase [Candidatus Edwardsbacteria bacterium]